MWQVRLRFIIYKSEFKQALLHLKISLESRPAGLGKYKQDISPRMNNGIWTIYSNGLK